ncbi:MAG TPA: GspH/FimT family pseudopilin [Pyrinomonadaceae bacterium]|nr:GspH/FimT family pseudopilin [Pyrinomonadaceae bacterium]
MPIASTKTSRKESFSRQAGFTTVQMLITIALVTIVSAFALFAIDSARASVRLTGSTREFASYLEKARSNAIRRNGNSIVTIVDQNNYSVNMDFDGDGTVETRTITLQNGVTFPAGQVGITATFDWRGRVASQIGFVLNNDRGSSSSINLSGSGDVTIGSEIFQDTAISEITLNSNPSTTVYGSPTPTPIGGSDPSASPSPSPETSPSPSPTAGPSPSPGADPSPEPTVQASPSPGSSPSASPGASPGTSPTPPVCVLSAPSTLTLPRNSSPKSFSVVTITNANNTVITATRAGDISSVSPASTTLSGNGTITYTIVYAAGSNRAGSVTVSSPCGNKTIAITFN